MVTKGGYGFPYPLFLFLETMTVARAMGSFKGIKGIGKE
jgi:hypothetical protein